MKSFLKDTIPKKYYTAPSLHEHNLRTEKQSLTFLVPSQLLAYKSINCERPKQTNKNLILLLPPMSIKCVRKMKQNISCFSTIVLVRKSINYE